MSEQIKLQVGRRYATTDYGYNCTIRSCDRVVTEDDGEVEVKLIFKNEHGVEYDPTGSHWNSNFHLTRDVTAYEEEPYEFQLEVGKYYEYNSETETVLITKEWVVTSKWGKTTKLLLGDNGLVYCKNGDCAIYTNRGRWDLEQETK